MNHPINTAITLLINVNKFGYEGLRAFALRKEQYRLLNMVEEDETTEQVVDRLASACWMGADYFRMWLGDENINYKKHEIIENINLKFLPNGVYYMEFKGNESHYWIWIITDDIIWYAGSYGGICNITVKSFERNNYTKRWQLAMDGSIEDYEYVFQIKAYYINEVGFDSLIYSKSQKYH